MPKMKVPIALGKPKKVLSDGQVQQHHTRSKKSLTGSLVSRIIARSGCIVQSFQQFLLCGQCILSQK